MMEDYNLHFPPVLISEEERMIHNAVRNFVDKEMMPVREQLEDDKELQHKILQGMVDIGLQKLFMPREYGGEGIKGSVLKACIAEELSRADVGICVSYWCTNWCWRPAISGNMKAILDEFMPSFCGDKLQIGSYDLTEPGGPHGGGGCDIENVDLRGMKIRTRARFEGDKCIINGSKLWASNSGNADLYCVACTIDPKLGEDGIVLAYVPRGWPGLTQGPNENKCGCKSDENCATYFDEVTIPKEWAIGPGGKATELFWAQLPSVGSGGIATGIMQGVLETVVEYTKERIVADKPIREHGGPKEVIADIAMMTEMSRSIYLITAYMFDHPEIYGSPMKGYLNARGNMVKITSENAVRCAEKAIQLMGSYGYVREYHVEKYWRDAMGPTLWKGGTRLARYNVCRGIYGS
jgi:alkylation response protein AidB-like acyl-CoA dehydrogenase